MLNFIKCFFCIYWDKIMVLSFLLIMWYIIPVDLHQMLNYPCTSGINPTWICCTILLMYCWISFVEDSCISVHQGYWPVIFLWCWCSYLDWYQGNDGLIKRFWKCLLLSFWGGRAWEGLALFFSLNVLLNLPVKQSDPGLLFVWRFLVTNSISLLVIS